MRVDKRNKNDCCGCGVCEKICPKNAIKMKQDEEGFLYPQIDNDKCINCGLCYKKCPSLNFNKKEEVYQKGYIAKNRNDDVRLRSRSGGIFAALSDWIFENNGIVYGCIIDESYKIIHVGTNSKIKRDEMCKSKYVQSNILDTFNDVVENLKNNKYVLFSGTGCQVDAILNYVIDKKVSTKKLITMDFVCHGCPSPKLFKDYIDYLNEKNNQKITSFQFRDKIPLGWNSHVESFFVGEKKKYSLYYTNLFHSALILRPSCYNCKYTTIRRNTDITVADAWGIDKNNHQFNDNRGVSFFMIHSKKKMILEILKEKCILKEVDFDDFYQQNMKSSTRVNVQEREKFWNIYRKNGFKGVLTKYKVPFNKKIKVFIKYEYNRIKKGRYVL